MASGNIKIKKYLKILAHLGALFTVTAWGTSFISTKVLMETAGLTPIEVYIYRFTIAYVLLLAITFKKIMSNTWRDELQFFFCGVCAGSLFYLLENYALQNTTTGNVSLLSSVSPLMTTALMAFIFRSRIGLGVAIGSIIAFIGVGFVIFSHGEGLEINPLGDLLALASSLSWSIYAIGVKRLVPVYNSLFVTRKLFFYGVLTALPLLLLQKAPSHLGPLFTNATYLLNLLFLVMVCSLAAYVVWNFSMKELGPVSANNYIYIQPLVTMLAAYFVFSEEISLLGYIGCALIIGGLIISDKLKIKIGGVRHIRK